MPVLLSVLTACTAPSVRDAGLDVVSGGQDVIEFNVTLEPDLGRVWVRGRESILFDPQSVRGRELLFTASALQITSVRLDGYDVPVRIAGDELHVDLPSYASDAMTSVLELTFEGAPGRGYALSDGAVVTTYFACDWMVCAQEAFGDKAVISLDLILPEPMTTVGPGVLVDDGITEGGKYHALWIEKRPYSPYLYAFAAGDFRTVTQQRGGVELRLVSAVANPNELERLFSPTAGMMAFFEMRSGVPLPQPVYMQLLVGGAAAQEAVSHSVIGRITIDPILQDPTEDWAIAHELAHQWWGNAITARDLSEFWLNEGVATFMVAVWKQERWGDAAYDREMALARGRASAAVEADMNVPLTYSGAYPSPNIRRAIQYSKGALFLDAIRSEVGEPGFWAGIADYTRTNMGRAVTTADFQRAMEEASSEGPLSSSTRTASAYRIYGAHQG